jgi:hypothetical protein
MQPRWVLAKHTRHKPPVQSRRKAHMVNIHQHASVQHAKLLGADAHSDDKPDVWFKAPAAQQRVPSAMGFPPPSLPTEYLHGDYSDPGQMLICTTDGTNQQMHRAWPLTLQLLALQPGRHKTKAGLRLPGTPSLTTRSSSSTTSGGRSSCRCSSGTLLHVPRRQVPSHGRSSLSGSCLSR